MTNRLLATLPALALGALLFLPGCRPPEDLDRGGAPKLGELSESRRGSPPPRQGPGEDGQDGGGEAGGDDGDGVRLSSRGLGKEDYALIAAELRCVRAQFKGQAEALGKAETAIFARYSASEDWVERVRAHLNGEPPRGDGQPPHGADLHRRDDLARAPGGRARGQARRSR